MNGLTYIICAIGLTYLTSCGTFLESSKYQLTDGIYRTKRSNEPTTRVYILVGEDSLEAFSVHKVRGEWQADTALPFPFRPVRQVNQFAKQYFTKASFDVDVLSIPFKFRPGQAEVPKQFTSSFNGALYVGYRSDRYVVSYNQTLRGLPKRRIRHDGFSLGAFAGLGATIMNSSVTRSQIPLEYDGVVFNKGISGILGVNNLTFGLGIGVDHLLDENHSVWIYQGKPWMGLTIGLNLN